MTPTLRIGTTAFMAVLTTSFLTLPTEASAQRRRVRPVTRSVVVLGGFYRPFLYDPWYYPFYPYGWFPPYGYAQYSPDSSLRLQVSPKETEVFVDGYLTGSVDDFDGFFQRLHLEPGEHEITLYLQGHRTARQMIYLQRGGTFRIRHTMEALPPGATADPRPVSPPAPGRNAPPPRRVPGAGPRPPGTAEAGTLAIRVQPADAEVFIDGERWEGPSDVNVRSGETERLNVSLSRQ